MAHPLLVNVINAIPAADGSIQCQAKSFFYPLSSRASHSECPERVINGYLCKDHAKRYYHVEVKKSLFEYGGLGLFATQRIRENIPICPYLGPVMSRMEFDKDPSVYGLRLYGGDIINPIRTWDCFARFANDCSFSHASTMVNNCFFLSERDLAKMFGFFSNGTARRVWLVSKRDISAGEELCADYFDR